MLRNSILAKFLGLNDSLLDKDKLRKAINDANGHHGIMAVKKRAPLKEAHFTSNIVEDCDFVEQLSSGDNLDLHFWLMTNNTQLKIDILNTIKEEHEFWIYQVSPLYIKVNDPLQKWQCTNDIIWTVIMYLIPQPQQVHIDPQILQNERYHDVIVGDQDGGIISCGKCKNKEYNPIWPVSHCNINTIESHITSANHCK